MLRNVKEETFQRKQFEVIQTGRAQPITNFFRRVGGTQGKAVLLFYHAQR